MNKFVYLGAIALLAVATGACHHDDADLDHVKVPEVAPVANTLSGFVTGLDGAAISGATVTAGNLTTTTDATGAYVISDIAAGTYTLTATAAGHQAQQSQLTVANANNENLVWSVALPKDISKSVNVTVNGGGEGEVVSEAIATNTKAEIPMTVDVPANTVPQNTTITISPIYTEDSDLITKATSESMLIGANITCSDPNLTLTNPFDVKFDVDNTVISSVVTKQYVNGQWVTVPHSTTADGVAVSTTTFGRIGLFFPVEITRTKSSQGITLNPSQWDNLYGNTDITAGVANYSYKSGSEFNARGANSLEALLIERLAQLVGPTAKTLNGSYPVNVTVPLGTAISLRATQATETVKVSSSNRSATGTTYGAVTVTVSTYNRQHNGSGN